MSQTFMQMVMLPAQERQISGDFPRLSDGLSQSINGPSHSFYARLTVSRVYPRARFRLVVRGSSIIYLSFGPFGCSGHARVPL
jgi:hypothetical protein